MRPVAGVTSKQSEKNKELYAKGAVVGNIIGLKTSGNGNASSAHFGQPSEVGR